MNFKLTEIYNLYTIPDRSCCKYGVAFIDRIYGDKRVDREQVYRNFLGSHDIVLNNARLDDEAFENAAEEFFNEGGQNDFTLQRKIIRRALEKQLPFLVEETSPAERFDTRDDDWMLNKEEMLTWLNKHEAEYGTTFDLQPADQIIPQDDSDVVALNEIKANFTQFMLARQFNPEPAFLK